jgi:hypothetical protein
MKIRDLLPRNVTMAMAIRQLWQYDGNGNTPAQKYATCWFAGYIN